MGYVEIRVLDDVRVEIGGRAFVGFFAIKGADAVEAGAATSVLRITGSAVLGYAECSVGRRPLPRSR